MDVKETFVSAAIKIKELMRDLPLFLTFFHVYVNACLHDSLRFFYLIYIALLKRTTVTIFQ